MPGNRIESGRQRSAHRTGRQSRTHRVHRPKILWVREHEPKVYERTKHILLPKDYIRFRMTGDYATEVSDASGTLLLDVVNRRWSDKLLRILQIDRALLPWMHESRDVTGTLSRQAAKELGLREGISIVGGAGDQAAG